jgi:hypothetical protein
MNGSIAFGGIEALWAIFNIACKLGEGFARG